MRKYSVLAHYMLDAEEVEADYMTTGSGSVWFYTDNGKLVAYYANVNSVRDITDAE